MAVVLTNKGIEVVVVSTFEWFYSFGYRHVLKAVYACECCCCFSCVGGLLHLKFITIMDKILKLVGVYYVSRFRGASMICVLV